MDQNTTFVSGLSPLMRTPALVLVGVALLTTVASGLDYLWRYRRFVL